MTGEIRVTPWETMSSSYLSAWQAKRLGKLTRGKKEKLIYGHS